ncbi:MAG TPA: transposase [Pseudoflavonifractor sp.]|nr:transposase [Pseudoflavonifractor sp.]
MNEFPKRKHPRLRNYDYSQSGAYFITICTENRQSILGTITVGRDDLIPPMCVLSPVGELVERYIQSITDVYQTAFVPGYVVMPNHVHILLVLERGGPSVMMIVRGFKRQVTKALGRPIWQDSFYEHTIRDEASYRKHLQYMENNPVRWAEDDYYCQSL